MHHIPHPKDQAETLMRIAKARGWKLGKQEALEVVAELQGFKSWQICSAAVNEALEQKPEQLKLKPQIIVDDCEEKEGKHLFVGTVTMEATMSAELGVWATDEDEARERLIEFAVDRYQLNGGSDFALDEGNWKDGDDFYLPDADSIENRSQLNVEGDDMFARATWADERGSYDVIFDRSEPDCSDEDRRFAVTATLTVKPNLEGVPEISKEFGGEVENYSASDGELVNQLQFEVEEGNFDQHIDKLLKKAVRDMKHRPRAKA